MMQHFRSALAIVVLIFVGVFAIQNFAAVDVSFLMWSASMPKIVVILGTYFLGMLTGWGMIDLIKKLFKKSNSPKSTVTTDSVST
jgi:uncharacterized integral membrane protein